MPFSGMLHRVALVRTYVSVERVAAIIRVTRIGELGTLAVTSNRRTLRRNTNTGKVVPCSPIIVTLKMEMLGSCETSVLTRATRRNNPEDTILHHIFTLYLLKTKEKQILWSLVRKQTIPTLRPPLAGEVNAIFCG
jgi:hypothetical protein